MDTALAGGYLQAVVVERGDVMLARLYDIAKTYVGEIVVGLCVVALGGFVALSFNRMSDDNAVVRSDLAAIGGRIDVVNGRVDAINGRIDGTNQRLDQLLKDGVDERIATSRTPSDILVAVNETKAGVQILKERHDGSERSIDLLMANFRTPWAEIVNRGRFSASFTETGSLILFPGSTSEALQLEAVGFRLQKQPSGVEGYVFPVSLRDMAR